MSSPDPPGPPLRRRERVKRLRHPKNFIPQKKPRHTLKSTASTSKNSSHMSQDTAQQITSPSPFEKFPLEIRMEVYKHVISGSTAVWDEPRTRLPMLIAAMGVRNARALQATTHKNLLLVSKQVYSEARGVYWQHTVIYTGDRFDHVNFPRAIAPFAREFIKIINVEEGALRVTEDSLKSFPNLRFLIYSDAGSWSKDFNMEQRLEEIRNAAEKGRRLVHGLDPLLDDTSEQGMPDRERDEDESTGVYRFCQRSGEMFCWSSPCSMNAHVLNSMPQINVVSKFSLYRWEDKELHDKPDERWDWDKGGNMSKKRVDEVPIARIYVRFFNHSTDRLWITTNENATDEDGCNMTAVLEE